MEFITFDSLFQYSLRECYFLKKYGHKWLHKTFGRVSPSRARYEYSKSLRRKLLHAWGEESCKKTPWILGVRADCNNKYRLMTRHWAAWKRFILLCRHKREQKARADHFLCISYAKILIPAWKDFVLLKKSRRQIFENAVEFDLSNSLLQSFHIWKDELILLREYRSLEFTALSLWHSGVRRRVWLVWMRRVQERFELKQLLETARLRYNTKIMRICFEGMNVYTLKRKERKSLNNTVLRNYERSLMSKFLRRWRDRRWKEKNVRDKRRQIETLASQCTLRRTWLAWLEYASKCDEERERKLVGRNFRVRALKSRGWRAILNAHRTRRELEWKSQVALQLWVLWRYRHAWSNWEERMEARIEVKQEPVSRIARQHYNRVVAARALIAFQTFLAEKKVKKQRHRIGEEHYEMALKLKSLSSLKRYVQMRSVERKHSSLSSRLLREICITRFFYFWVSRLEERRETNELMEKAEYFHSVASLRWSLSQWQRKYSESNKEHLRILTAVISYNMKLQRKLIVAWKQFVLSCQQQRESKAIARTEYQVKVLRNCFVRMKSIHERNEFIRKRCHKLVSVLGLISVRKAFDAWKKFIVIAREERGVLTMAENHWKTKVQGNVLKEWQKNIEFLKTQKEMNRKAGIFWISNLIIRYFHIWKSARLIMIERAVYETEIATKVTAVVHRGCLYRCFWGWLVLKDKAVIKRYNRMKADSYFSICITKRGVSKWKSALTNRRKLMVNYQRAIWFCRSSLLARTYTHWRLQLNRQLYYNHRHTLALWKWSRSLERRVFGALKWNASENRRMRSRYDRASDQFRNRVVMKGILQILHTGNAVLTAEESSVLKKIEKHTKFSWGCALRCARIWRQKTLANKGKKENSDFIKFGMAVPDLDINFPKFTDLISGFDNFCCEMTDFTAKTSSLPAPRIPEYLKQKWNQVTSSADKEPSSDFNPFIPERLPTLEQNPVASAPGSSGDMILGISPSDMKLLRDTKEQLVQLFDSKQLLKSMREGLDSLVEESESSYDARNRVHEFEEHIQTSEIAIKQNMNKLSRHFQIPANFEK